MHPGLGSSLAPSWLTGAELKTSVGKHQARSQEAWILVKFLIFVHLFTKYLLDARHCLSERK